MRQLTKVFLLGGTGTIALYLVLWLASGLWDGPARARMIDSQRGEADLYRTPIREFVYRLPAFCRNGGDQKNVFIVGGSTAMAYRPDDVAPYLPGAVVSNVSLEFTNITQIRQAVTLLRGCLGRDGFHRAVMVVALDYNSFAANGRRFEGPYTVLESELLRHGLFDGLPGAVRARIPWRFLSWVIVAMRPIFAAYGLQYEGRAAIDRARQKPHDNREEARRDRAFGEFESRMGPATATAMDEQRKELDGLIADVRDDGGNIAFIDIPVQGWLRKRSPHYARYRAWLGDYSRRNGVIYIDHSLAGEETDFVDGRHANPAGARRWSALAGAALQSALRVP